MAKRPVFIPAPGRDRLVDKVEIEFVWNPGFAPVQKKKNIVSLHENARKEGLHPLLEVSTKADDPLGQRLSAFNLKIETQDGPISLEAAFQGSKVFEEGGPYTDLYEEEGRAAKKDPRLRASGKLSHFDFHGDRWPLTPKTAFYDWLYLRAIGPCRECLEKLGEYKGFTDIEFNPEKSINCQARACALVVSLVRRGWLDAALKSPAHFIDIVARTGGTWQPSSALARSWLP
jgi:hypothetical protein